MRQLFSNRSTLWQYTEMTKTIRVLDRALLIIQTVATSDSCALTDIHHRTGIPKPTLLRLIRTLVQRGYLRQSIIDGRYRASIILPESEAEPVPRELVLLADKAMPHALALTEEIGWPSDIHLRSEHFMTLVDTTRPMSPFHVYQKQYNQRLSLYGSATGLACLSRMPRDRVERLFFDPKPDFMWRPERFRLSWQRFCDILDETRERGYAKRLSQHTGEMPIDDGMRAIALPLRRKGAPIGAINVFWPFGYKTEEAFAQDHLDVMFATVGRIDAALGG